MLVGYFIGVATTALLAWLLWSMRAGLPPKDMPGDW